VQRWLAFTLIEIVLAVFILMLLLLLAVPSLSGVLANNRLRRSLNGFNNLVRQAQERSVVERANLAVLLELSGDGLLDLFVTAQSASWSHGSR
jgi:Tfp pilus assembly protein FimT